MQRPLMETPIFDPQGNLVQAKRQRVNFKDYFLRSVRLIWRVMMFNPLHPHRRQLKVEDGTFTSRILRGLLYRLAFVPLFITIAIGAMVFLNTHPPAPGGETDPSADGLYFEPLTFLSSDNVPLEAWVVPVLDARQVLKMKDRALQKKYPAVILVHDFGQSRQQVMPLIKPLHEAGFVVMALATRGEGTGSMVAQTFGIKESLDTAEAVDVLRRRPFVDERRIAVIGIGSGANAAILAAERESGINALVLYDPIPSGQTAVNRHIAPLQSWLSWMQPLCKWAFEIGYQVDAEDIDMARHKDILATRPVLKFESINPSTPSINTAGGNLIGKFLTRRMSATAVAGTGG